MVFRLSTVLEHRRRRTEELEIELAGLLRQISALEASRVTLQRERDQTRDAVGGTGKLDLEEISRKLGYLTMIERRLVENAEAIADLHVLADAKRAEVASALKEQKKVESLRDRSIERDAFEERLADIRLSDELGTIGYNAQHVAREIA